MRQYPFLKTLGLEEVNHGVYRNGKWIAGGGEKAISVSPHTNEDIGTTTMGNAQDYDDCIKAM